MSSYKSFANRTDLLEITKGFLVSVVSFILEITSLFKSAVRKDTCLIILSTLSLKLFMLMWLWTRGELTTPTNTSSWLSPVLSQFVNFVENKLFHL
jgi:hypothetical protein